MPLQISPGTTAAVPFELGALVEVTFAKVSVLSKRVAGPRPPRASWVLPGQSSPLLSSTDRTRDVLRDTASQGSDLLCCHHPQHLGRICEHSAVLALRLNPMPLDAEIHTYPSKGHRAQPIPKNIRDPPIHPREPAHHPSRTPSSPSGSILNTMELPLAR